jgi:hypothetical protein
MERTWAVAAVMSMAYGLLSCSALRASEGSGPQDPLAECRVRETARDRRSVECAGREGQPLKLLVDPLVVSPFFPLAGVDPQGARRDPREAAITFRVDSRTRSFRPEGCTQAQTVA